MNRLLTVLNFVGVLVLVSLCIVQWRQDRLLHLHINDLDGTIRQQSAKIVEQDNQIRADRADLDDFRTRLELAESQLKEMESNLNKMTAERNQLGKERDQLKAEIAKFIAALAERDQILKADGDQIARLAAERNDMIAKFNDVAEKYNKLVKDVTESRRK